MSRQARGAGGSLERWIWCCLRCRELARGIGAGSLSSGISGRSDLDGGRRDVDFGGASSGVASIGGVKRNEVMRSSLKQRQQRLGS